MFNFGNITAHGEVYLYPEKPPANLVWTDPKGHTNFWCSVQGDTSGSSSSPRTEGRQTLPMSAAPYNWRAGEGAINAMFGTVRVELAPSSGKVIVGQIHAHKAPNPFVMITWWNGFARIDVRLKPTGSSSKVLSIPCALGQTFEYSLMVGLDEVLHFTIKHASADGEMYYGLDIDPSWKQYPFYFKAGAYVIDNDGPETEGGWVVYEKFDVYNGGTNAEAN